MKVAARGAGIDYDTMKNWMKRGKEEGSGRYFAFFVAVKEALAKAEEMCLLRIQEDQSWQSKAWIMERRYGNRWAKTERHELTGKDGGPIQIDWAALADGLDD